MSGDPVSIVPVETGLFCNWGSDVLLGPLSETKQWDRGAVLTKSTTPVSRRPSGSLWVTPGWNLLLSQSRSCRSLLWNRGPSSFVHSGLVSAYESRPDVARPVPQRNLCPDPYTIRTLQETRPDSPQVCHYLRRWTDLRIRSVSSLFTTNFHFYGPTGAFTTDFVESEDGPLGVL